MSYDEWRPYVSVAQRRANARREMNKLIKKGNKIEPIELEGRHIARSFWGDAWCKHLEKFSDYANRLPRGRTYVRNGSVCHLAISKGKIKAIVSGSELYNINIQIKPLAASKWKTVRQQCAGQIGSMLELLQGRFSDQVMKIVTDRSSGLFPEPREIKLACDCPDWAEMCKHIAAVMYGIGARLDQQPELLFLLRNVDHEELISEQLNVKAATTGTGKGRRLGGQVLADVFGVEIDDAPVKGRKKPTAARQAGKVKLPVQTRRAVIVRSIKTPVTKKKAAGTIRKKAITKNRTVVKQKFTSTAAGVRRLRKAFGMNQSQFARLLGVSPPTVANWENGSGKLKLQPRSQQSLLQAAKLTPAQAMKKIH